MPVLRAGAGVEHRARVAEHAAAGSAGGCDAFDPVGEVEHVAFGARMRDERREARQESRDVKQECKAGDEKSRAECRQDKRDVKQDARGPEDDSVDDKPAADDAEN